MKIVFIGLGSIGLRHARLIHEMWPDYKLYAVRSGEGKTKTPRYIKEVDWKKNNLNIEADVAFICNPTYLHIQTALVAAKLGLHLFIEKPIDVNVNYLDALIGVVSINKLTAYVAYPLRFCRAVQRFKKYGLVTQERLNQCSEYCCETDASKWREYKTYSSSYILGGGALLDLSHEIDLAEYLSGPIESIHGWLIKKENDFTDAETIAQLGLKHTGGHCSSVLLDIASDRERRYFKIGNLAAEIKVDDYPYREQLKYFFANLNNPVLMNNLFSATKLFCKMVEFREGAYGSNYDLRSCGQQGVAQ